MVHGCAMFPIPLAANGCGRRGWGVLATGHTAATAQMTTHAAHCAAYALKAAPNLKKERDWQYRRPLEHLRRVVFPSLAHD